MPKIAPKKRNPQDLTLRNERSIKKSLQKIEQTVACLQDQNDELWDELVDLRRMVMECLYGPMPQDIDFEEPTTLPFEPVDPPAAEVADTVDAPGVE